MTRKEIKDFCDMKAQLEPENEDIFKAIIKALEQEPKAGHWVKRNLGWGCSECNLCTNDKGMSMYYYCPQCGAKMVQPQDEEI